MQDVVSTPSRMEPERQARLSLLVTRARSEAPSLVDCAIAFLSAVLLVLSFPDFNLWPLAWIALTPLLLVVARQRQPWPAFLVGWLWGAVFFFGSCHWLTHSIINFGGFPPWLAYPILIPGALLLGMFPGVFGAVLAQLIRRLGIFSMLLAPLLWPPLEWARLAVTGQLWNAIGYSQAFHPWLIQTSRWAGVYIVGFLIIAVNAAIALALFRRTARALLTSVGVVLLIGLILVASNLGAQSEQPVPYESAEAVVIAIQPNVPMDLVKSVDEMQLLNARHFEMSQAALSNLSNDDKPRLLIWPESPMNFTYGADTQFRERLAQFARQHHSSILLNSQEAAPNDGIYNSAVLINEEGSLVAQYDKIRLMPFGEYVPLPQWLPGAGLIRGIVGDFTPGTNYRLMPIGKARAGVFICIESAYPSIARNFSREGANVLINISNDGYLGPTAVMRQHLANAIFRSVENERLLLRVTNTGISAAITSRGEARDATEPFRQEVRIWNIAPRSSSPSFYANYGDLFVACCGVISFGVFLLTFKRRVSG